MTNQPLVSVILPVYNGEPYLRDSLESVLNQTYHNFELLVINDGSTDGSEKIILSYPDKRIHYLKNEVNSGLIATLNKGIGLATGKYIVRMDADDICLPGRFEKQVLFMESHSEIGICGCCADVIDKKGLKMNYDADDASIRVKMLYQCHMFHPSVIIRKEVFDQHNLKFDPDFIHAEDYELFYRIGKFTKLANLTEVLLLYREHQGSVSRIYKQIQHDNSLKVIRQQFEEIGVSITDAEIDLFKDVMNSGFNFTKTQIETIEKLLLRIIAANYQSKKMNQSVLNSILFQKWKDMLMNVTKYGLSIYRLAINSPLSRYGSFSIPEKVKLFIKALLKY